MATPNIATKYHVLEPFVSDAHVRISMAKHKQSGEVVNYHEIMYDKLLVHPQEPDFTGIDKYMQLRHPCLLNILDVYHNKPAHKVVVVTECTPTHELADMIANYKMSNTIVPEEQIWAIMYSICAGLSYCHSNNKQNCPKVPKLVHKHVSPFTVLVGENTQMLTKLRFPDLFTLLDIRNISDCPTSQLMYMAPEILRREKYTDKADVWSLGCIVYELCTLSVFTKVPSSEVIRQTLEGCGRYIKLPHYSASLEDLLTRMLTFNEADRISSHEILLWPEMQSVASLVTGIPVRTNSQLMATIRGNAADGLRQSTADLVNRLNATYGRTFSMSTLTSSMTKEMQAARSSSIGDPTTRPLSVSSTGGQLQNYISSQLPWKSTLMRSGQMGHSFSTSNINSPGMVNFSAPYNPIVGNITSSSTNMSMTASQLQAAEYSSMVSNAAKMGNDAPIVDVDVASQILKSRRVTEPINNQLASQRYSKTTTDIEEVAPVVVNEIMTDFLSMRYGVKVDKEHLVDRIFNVIPGKIVNADKEDLDPGAPDVQRDIRRHSPNDIVDLLMVKKELDDRLEPYAYRLGNTSESYARELYKQSLDQDTYVGDPSASRIGPGGTASAVGKDYVASATGSQVNSMLGASSTNANTGSLTNSKRAKSRSKSRGKSASISKDSRLRSARSRSKLMSSSCCSTSVQDSFYGEEGLEMLDPSMQGTASQVLPGTVSSIGKTVITRPNDEGDKMIEIRVLDEEQMRLAEEARLQEQLENEIEVTIKTHNDMAARDSTPLMLAASSDNIDKVRLLIPTHGGEITTKGITALMMAASAGHVRTVKLLIPKEGRMQDKDGMTALMYAAHFGKLEAVKELVESEHNKVNKAGLTALMIAADYGNTEVVRFLRTYESKKFSINRETAMMRAAKLGHVDIVKELLEFEAKLQNSDGLTALMIAIQCGNSKVATILADSEAGVTSSAGWTALMSCAVNSDVETARMLVNYEANMRDKYDETALMKAAKSGAVNVARILLPVEACQTRYDGKSALMCAAEAGHASIVSLLMPKECRMKRTDGTTALMCAAQSNCIPVIRLLLSSEKRMQKLDGETALIRAIRWSRPEAVQELVREEGNLNLYDERTVLDVAKQAGNRDIIDIIFANL